VPAGVRERLQTRVGFMFLTSKCSKNPPFCILPPILSKLRSNFLFTSFYMPAKYSVNICTIARMGRSVACWTLALSLPNRVIDVPTPFVYILSILLQYTLIPSQTLDYHVFYFLEFWAIFPGFCGGGMNLGLPCPALAVLSFPIG
jgi:hypothetical protein